MQSGKIDIVQYMIGGRIYHIELFKGHMVFLEITNRGPKRIGRVDFTVSGEGQNKKAVFNAHIRQARGLLALELAQKAIIVFKIHHHDVKELEGKGSWQRQRAKPHVVRSHNQINKLIAGGVRGSRKPARSARRRK